jgi:hypothetical protein
LEYNNVENDYSYVGVEVWSKNKTSDSWSLNKDSYVITFDEELVELGLAPAVFGANYYEIRPYLSNNTGRVYGESVNFTLLN